jgi:hypothetical protein
MLHHSEPLRKLLVVQAMFNVHPTFVEVASKLYGVLVLQRMLLPHAELKQPMEESIVHCQDRHHPIRQDYRERMREVRLGPLGPLKRHLYQINHGWPQRTS